MNPIKTIALRDHRKNRVPDGQVGPGGRVKFESKRTVSGRKLTI